MVGSSHLLGCAALLMVALAGTAVPAAAQAPTTVQTVPRIPGIDIAVDGEVARTDHQGLAQFSSAARLTADTINVEPRVRLSQGRRARFSRIRRTDTGYVAAFDVDVLVTVDAATVGGDRIDPDRASRVTLRSPLTGEWRDARIGEQVWLHSSRVVAELGTVRPREVSWSVQRFEIDGRSVVSRGQQRFVPAELPADARTVRVRARLFAVDVTTSDALLGSPTGTQLLLTHPDGQVSRHPLSSAGTARVQDLVPGAYELAVAGSGPLIARPVTISRDQQIDLDVYTWWDVAIAVGVAVLFFAGLAVLGRRRPVTRRTEERIVEPAQATRGRRDHLVDDPPGGRS